MLKMQKGPRDHSLTLVFKMDLMSFQRFRTLPLGYTRVLWLKAKPTNSVADIGYTCPMKPPCWTLPMVLDS